jgi:hypothetical protein
MLRNDINTGTAVVDIITNVINIHIKKTFNDAFDDACECTVLLVEMWCRSSKNQPLATANINIGHGELATNLLCITSDYYSYQQ